MTINRRIEDSMCPFRIRSEGSSAAGIFITAVKLEYFVETYGGMRASEKICGLIAVTVVASLGLSGTAASAAPAGGTDASIDAADRAFSQTLTALEPYLSADAQGRIALDAPQSVVATVDPIAYEFIVSNVTAANDSASASTADDTDPAFPEDEIESPGGGFSAAGVGGAAKAFVKAVKAVWKPIVKAAKKSRKWAWYKATRCANGAVSALWSFYDGDASSLAHDLATSKSLVIGIATAGCIRKL